MKKITSFLIFIILILSIKISFADIVAEVNGKPITWLEMQNRYQILWKNWKKNSSKYPEISEETYANDLKKLAIKQLIKEELFKIYAKENSIYISNQELITTFKEIYSNNKMFLTNGLFDTQKFQNFKNKYPQKFRQIIEQIRNDVLKNKITKIIEEKFQLSERELFEEYFKRNSEIKLKYIIFPDSLMPSLFPSTPSYFQKFYQENKRKILASKNIFWFLTRNSQKDSMKIWKEYILNGKDLFFQNFANDYYKENIENHEICKVNLSYFSFNKKNFTFDINIEQDSIESYYKKNIEEFVTVRDTLLIEKVQGEIYETLYENEQKILTDSLIVEIIQKVQNNDFGDSIPNTKIAENIELIEKIPYYENFFKMISDTIFTTSKDSIFIKKRAGNIIIGRINKKEKIPNSQKKNLKNLIEKKFRKKWDENWENRFQEYYQSQKDTYFTKEKFKLQYLFFPNIADSQNVSKLFNSVNSTQDSIFVEYLDSLRETDYILLDSDSVLIDSLFWLHKIDFEIIENSQIGEKFPKISYRKNGYLILFLKEKIPSEKISGYQAFNLAREKFAKIIKYEQCKKFTRFIIENLKNGNKSLLPIFGGFTETDWLLCSDEVEDFENDEIVLNDAFSHSKFSFSQPIRLCVDGFGFYFVEDKKEIDYEQFRFDKDKFCRDYYKKKFTEWLENFKKEKNVKVFFIQNENPEFQKLDSKN